MDDILWREWESVKHRGKTHGEICGTSSQKGGTWDMWEELMDNVILKNMGNKWECIWQHELSLAWFI